MNAQGGHDMSTGVPWPDLQDPFARHYEACTRIDIGDLPAGAVLHVSTEHSTYRIQVVDGPKHIVRVQGGRLFADESVARLDGSTAGGNLLASGYIVAGLRVELCARGGRILTSRVSSIDLEEPVAVSETGAGHS